jgi:eukaryotic-like serine/threonine-protein kinase
MEDKQIGHYRITRRLGSGGMGEVYLAEDSRLKRLVALKLLLAESTADRDRVLRFHHEARAASALSHPNIVTIYEVGEDQGQHFIATEFIDGETLRRRIDGRPLPVNDVVDIAIGIASALVAAHEIGIIHRDIKPDNVMIRRDGYVKVLDFGLAKLMENSTFVGVKTNASKIPMTDPGLVMGTVHYMSPEQLRGDEIDHRSDLFSLGEVMYEMIAGVSPFDGASTSEIIAAILDRDPLPLGRFSRTLPQELDRIVEKLLRKDKLERYQSARDVLTDLRTLKQDLEYKARLTRESGGMRVMPDDDTAALPLYQVDAARRASSGSRQSAARKSNFFVRQLRSNRDVIIGILALVAIIGFSFVYFSRAGKSYGSIAVLPFVNVSNDPEAEYLTDGITESIIHSLSQVPTLQVMAQSSVFRFKGKGIDPRAAGRELDVTAVLTGRVHQRGDMLLVQADLVDVEKGTLLWGEQYNRRSDDLLIVQNEIAKQISERLRLRLSGEDRQRLTKSYTQDPEAYKLYLKGRYQWNKRTADGLRRAIQYFEKAIEREPTYALAYAGLADSYSLMPVYARTPAMEAYPRARAAARKALEIDDSLAEAHTSLAWASLNEWRWEEAEREFKRSIQLKPNYATAHQWYSLYLSAMGRHDEAITEIQEALESDPLSLTINTTVGTTYYLAARYDEASEQFRRTLDLEPGFPRARFEQARVDEVRGNAAKAIPVLEELSKGGNPGYLAALARGYARAGRKDEANALVAKLKSGEIPDYVNPYDIAAIYEALGNKDEVFVWLNRAYAEHVSRLAYIRVEPMFAALRTDPRFIELAKKIGVQ